MLWHVQIQVVWSDHIRSKVSAVAPSGQVTQALLMYNAAAGHLALFSCGFHPDPLSAWDPKVRLAQVHPESRKSTELKHVQSSLKSSNERWEIHQIHYDFLNIFETLQCQNILYSFCIRMYLMILYLCSPLFSMFDTLSSRNIWILEGQTFDETAQGTSRCKAMNVCGFLAAPLNSTFFLLSPKLFVSDDRIDFCPRFAGQVGMILRCRWTAKSCRHPLRVRQMMLRSVRTWAIGLWESELCWIGSREF